MMWKLKSGLFIWSLWARKNSFLEAETQLESTVICHFSMKLEIAWDFPGGSEGVTYSLRVHLPMQGTGAHSLVWEDPTRCEAAKPVSQSPQPAHSAARAPHQEDPLQFGAQAPQLSRPHSPQAEKACAKQPRPSAAVTLKTKKKT